MIFKASHNTDIPYPAYVILSSARAAQTQAEFASAVASILQSQATTSVLQSLIARSNEERPRERRLISASANLVAALEVALAERFQTSDVDLSTLPADDRKQMFIRASEILEMLPHDRELLEQNLGLRPVSN